MLLFFHIVLVIFSVYSLFRLGNFYCSVFKFTGFFSCPLYSTVETTTEYFIALVFFSVLKLPFVSSLYLLFLYQDLIVHNYSLKHFMIVALKSLSDHSNLWFIPLLVSALIAFLIQVVIFLILGMMGDFLLYPGYYVTRLWLLFKSLLHKPPLMQHRPERGVLVGVKVGVLLLASINSRAINIPQSDRAGVWVQALP